MCEWPACRLFSASGILRGRPRLFAGAVSASSSTSRLGRPRLRGRFVPGGASRLTVQYDPKPGSVTGRGCRSNNLFNDRWCLTDC